MLFGQSIFQSVLTRLKENDDSTDEGSSPFRIQGLSGSFVAETPSTPAGDAIRAVDSYLAFPADLPAKEQEPDPAAVTSPTPPPIPQYLLQLSESEITRELAMGPNETAQTLAEKRRQFARHNHPDCVPAQYRDNATIRMKTANLLIDRALKDLSWR